MQVAVRITSLWIWWIAVASLVSQLFNQSTIVGASLMTEGPALRARNGSLLLSLGSGGHNRYGKGTLRFELSKRHIWKIVFFWFRLLWRLPARVRILLHVLSERHAVCVFAWQVEAKLQALDSRISRNLTYTSWIETHASGAIWNLAFVGCWLLSHFQVVWAF
jgi:hypothetical protein